jgi:hypothetical protein
MLLILHLLKKHRQRPIPKSFNLHFYSRLVVKINQSAFDPNSWLTGVHQPERQACHESERPNPPRDDYEG